MKKGKHLLSGFILVLSIFAIISLAVSGEVAKKTEPRKVRIGYTDSGKGVPGNLVGIAVLKGFVAAEFKKIGVEPELISFAGVGPAICEGLSSKSLDLGCSGDTSAMLSKASGNDTILLSACNSPYNLAIVVPVDSKIKTVADLDGKKVATVKGTITHRALIEILRANEMTVKSIKFFNLPYAEQEAALAAKQVDAIVTQETVVARMVLKGQGRILADCTGHQEWKGLSLVLSRQEYAKANPDVLIAFLKALIKAKNYADANPDDTKTTWTQNGLSREVYDYLFPDNKFHFEVGLSDKVMKTLANIRVFLKEEKLLKNDLNIEEWADPSYYQKALK